MFSTWQINVECLSEEALTVLHGVAIFGSAPIPENLLKEVLNEVSQENEASEIRYSQVVVHDELVRGSSILHRRRDDSEDWFDIHR